jgi:(2Fe-2S) ferredoxin
MEKPKFHFFVCASFRHAGDPKGVCHKYASGSLLQYLENELVDRGLEAVVTSTGCMKVCDRGPAMVVYPQGHWYGKITEDTIDEILDKLEDDEVLEEHLIA